MSTITKKPYRFQRYIVYAIATIVAVGMPFIKINENQIFLLSFDKKQLHLIGMAFDMQELYMMPFLLMLLFIGIFGVTALWGRAWCGWACPQTIFRVIYRDLIESKLLGLRRIKNKQNKPDLSKGTNLIKQIIAITLWSSLSILAAADFMWYFIPPDDFFAYMQNPFDHTIILGFIIGIAGFLIYDVIFLKEDFCIYVCPYSRVQTVLYDNETKQAIYDTNRGGNIYNDKREQVIFKPKELGQDEECTTCQKCVTVCPTHIDIRKGMQLECINCLECVDACASVMGKLGKETLVHWSSTANVIEKKVVPFFRKKTVMYTVAIVMIIAMLVKMGGEKEYMLLNVNKTTKLYSIKDDGARVVNNFVLLFQNTQQKEHIYDLEIVGKHSNDFEIQGFRSFSLSAGGKVKKVIRLSTTSKLSNDTTKDTSFHVTIKAFAIDDTEKIMVLREAVFTYPRADKLK